MQTITFTNKSALNQNSDISDINKCNAVDMNEIKTVVNANATEAETKFTNLSTMSSQEINTGRVFVDGKPIYSKTISFSTSVSPNSTITVPHNIANIDTIWIDVSNTFWINTTKRSYPIPMTNYDVYSNTESATPFADASNVGIVSVGGWGTSWTKYITVNYTKTTD